MKSPRFLSVLLLFLLPLCIGMMSCKTGRPVRKTLPDQLSGEGFSDKFWENSGSGFGNGTKIAPDLPFYAADTTISGKDFTAIYLRDPQYDSLAASIIKSYEPFANSVLKMIAGQGIKGIVVDLRTTARGNDGQANFRVGRSNAQRLEADNSPSIDIVFLWDNLSAERAAGFMNILSGSPLLAVKEISHKNSFAPNYKEDCFKPTSPDFEDQ
jgi:hypothetical protein